MIMKEKRDFISQDSEEEWFNKILDHASSKVNSGLSVLIFFDTDVEMDKFKNKFLGKFDCLHKKKYIDEAGITKLITLATRGMGHGVDFKSSVVVERNSGLHVIQTFFSLDIKEETQIKERTALKDNKGSYELILCKEHLINAGFLEEKETIINYKSLSKSREQKIKEKGSNNEKRIKESENKFNIQNQQISTSGKNVSSLRDVEQAIEYLNSLGNWVGNEHLLASTAGELNKRYRELRKDIRENANFWSYSQYCERLVYHYYNLACYFNDELFNKYKVDLRSVKKHLEKCLEKLAEVSQEDYSNEIKELKNDAEKLLAEVNEIYKQQNNLLTKYSNSNIRKYTKLCIVLGNINQVPLQQSSDEDRKHLEQQIQNIQLLRIINMLEDAITVIGYKDTFITAEKSNYLGQAYQLAGQSSLSARYTRTAENLVKKCMNSEAKECDNKKEIIEEIISREIEEYQSNLVEVKNYIEKKFHKSFSSVDDAYIEREYIGYCSKFWLQEITGFLKKLTESKSNAVIQEVFSSLDSIKSLIDVPNLFKQLEYYKLLIDHYKLVSKENEKTLISRFKKECLEQTVAYTEAAGKELKFLKTFVDFLSASQYLQSITAELELEDFCCGESSFDEFLKGIIDLDIRTYGASLAALQEAAKCLQQEEELFLIGKFKEVIGAYIKPVEIQERKIDGRLVIEVTGKNVVVSEILCRLENKLSGNSNIEEVRFVGADIIHVDANLENEIWRGKNIVILTKVIKLYDEVAWNVSGKDNNRTYFNNAGTGKDGHGKQGADGYAGESGGNILVLVEEMESPENFTIISHGGKGSKGQDGGNGKDGEDGKGITKTEFDEKFPSVADFGSGSLWRDDTIKKILENIENDSLTVKTVWYTGANNATIEKIIKDIEDIRFHNQRACENVGDSGEISLLNSFEHNIFIETVTSQRGGITFSFEHGGGLTSRQAFFLYKGSLGQPGGHGGEYGLGGQGGYAGEVIVRNPEYSGQKFGIMKNTKQGEEGEKGQGGLYGSHGKNGWDMGYLDHKWWTKAKFRDQGKYKVEYYDHDNNPSDRIWCPHKNKFAGITAANIEHKKQKKYEERKSTRKNSDRQHHAQAVKKKNILQDSILASYSHHLSSIEKSTLQDLRSDLENTKQRALQAITENQEQQEKLTMELGIKRHVSSVHQGKNKHHNDTIPSATYKDTTNVDGLIDKLKGEPQLLDNWLQLRGIEITRSELNELFSDFATVKKSLFERQSSLNDTENSELQSIEKLLIDKYRIATLQEIAKQLPPYQEVTDNIELTPESAARYLVEKEKGNNISHPSLGTLNQYLYENGKEQREKISKFYKEELQNTNNEALKCSMRAFVLEVGKSEEAHTGIKRYCDEYKEFLEKQEYSLNIFFEAFKSELSRPRHTEVFDLSIKSIKDKSLTSELEEKIQKDNFLNVLYNRFNNQLKQEYNWNKCCKDQDILKEYNDYIREKGPLLESYRELLAYVFAINVRLYVEDQDNKLFLQDNHNSLSRQIIHMLRRGDEFIQLNIDKNYLKLEEERKKKDDLYAKVLIEIEPFKQKQEFDNYLKNKVFLSHNNPSEDEQSYEQSFNEEKDIRKIITYFPKGERKQLKERLEKIVFQYTGQRGILHSILQRFSSEGRRISFQELCYLIISVITSSAEDRKEQNTFCWIVASYPQGNWIDEIILLELENYFKKSLEEKSKWREYLSKIESKDILLLFGVKLDQCKPGNSISTKCIDGILYLLSNIPNEPISLAGLALSEWPYVLKEKYWFCRLSQLTSWQESEKLPTAHYYLLSVENIFGTDLVEKFIEILKDKEEKLSPDTLIDILSNCHHERWNLSEEELKTLDDCDISEWTQKMQQQFTADKEERDVARLVKLIKGDDNTSKRISDKLPKIEDSIRSICNGKYVISGKFVSSFTKDDIERWVKEFRDNIGKREQDIEGTRKEMLAVIDRAIELRRGFKLRDTQRLTVLALLTNDRSTLAQVSTGEGKSLIVVAASIMKALWGEKVDIVSSSSVLAKRDAKGNRDIYSLFDINVSHNCSEDIEKRKKAYSGNQVVYGDLSNFQRDYLLDKFYGKNILGDRNFKNVIIDEVDSMLLDKGNNMLYLSHDLAGLDKLESVYIYIWQWINGPARDREELSYVFNTKAIKEAVLNNLYGLVKKEDIGKLGSELSKQQKNIIWERLIKAEILDGQGKLLRGSVDDIKLNKVLSPEFISYEDRLDYLFKECIERKKFIHVPNHLRPFIEQHLEFWINSAITAFFMKAGQDYVVDVDRTGTSPDRNPNITILDRDTGTDQANSQWDEALHQFLQLKHGCKLSLQSLKAVFISNVSFFKLYNDLYGLTGTLGLRRERNLLKEIYEVDFVTIPTAKCKQFRENKPMLCTNKEEWINHIHNEIKKLTEKRSVLVICETVNDVEILHKALGGKDAKHVHTYTRDYEEFDISQGNKELEQGQVIIATNLVGRGTDIKLTKKLREEGGLHICLTYLPNNIRVEQQAFGRAARSGDKGSGQLIIMGTKGQEYSNLKIWVLRKERDDEESHRISDIKAYYKTQITVEENCFKKFKEQYEKLNRMLSDSLRGNSIDETSILDSTVVKITNISSMYNLLDLKDETELKEILLQSCLDRWAFWLDRNSKQIVDVKNEQSKRGLVDNSLNEFLSQLKNLRSNSTEDLLAWVEGNPVQMVKLGKYLSKNEKYKDAIRLFDEVIKQESYFSEAAHYYKASALAKEIDWEQKPLKEEDQKILKRLKKELREAARLLDEHSKFSMNAAGIIGIIKKNNNESIIQINAYEEQQKSLSNLYYMFSQSIDNILGHFVTPQSFVHGDIKEELAEVVYEDLLREDILKKPRVKKNISEEELKMISAGYGVSVEILKVFLSKYEGEEINEKEFQKMLKEAVPLPSREAFWKSLIKQEILNEEVKYVVVDGKKLREVDPSLLDSLDKKVKKGEMEKQTLQSGNEEIFFNVKRIEQQKNNDNLIFKKDDFKAIGEGKYQILKKKGALSFNRKAHIDKGKIGCISLPHYDSITLEDFTKVNITKNEAEKILAELGKQKVIEKKDGSENSASYGLKIKFDEIKQIQLPPSPVYEGAVKRLLSVCFTYRTALQEIANKLEEKDSPVCLELMTKPHQSLALELLEQRVIRPVTVTTEDLEEKLKSIYSLPTTKDNFILMLSQSKLVPEGCTVKLFDHLVEKGWIYNRILQLVPSDPLKSIPEEVIGKENIENAAKFLVPDLYYISDSDKRQMPLNSSYKDIEDTIKKILDRRLQLAKEDTIKNITRTLERSRSALKALKVPDSKLEPLTEFCGLANIEEVHVFFLNGLDQLLQLEEKKWTREMLLNTAGVVAIGTCQIMIGTVIQLYSVGIMTHVGAAFVNEGVNDIFFAADALRSGYFSWNDYKQHKLNSLMTTATTSAIGAYLSRGANVSHFGHALAGPNFEFGGKVAEMAGTQLIQTVGLGVIGKEVAKRIILKAIEGVTFSLANAGVDTLVENYLQALCEGIASKILSDIEREVEKHNISKSLEEAYKTLGEPKAKRMIDNLTESVFSRKSYVEEFLPIANKIASSVTQGIAEAVKKRSKTSNKLELPICTISKIAVYSEHAAQIFNITIATSNLLNNLDQEIKNKFNSNEVKKNSGLNQMQEAEKDYESFKQEIIDRWKSLLRQKACQVITQHIISPILKESANCLVGYVGRKIVEAYQSYKESGYREYFERRKQEYHEELRNTGEQQHDNTSQTEKHITEKYHKDLLKLMKKTRSPHLFAAIVRENVPMGMTCVSACTQVIHRVLERQGLLERGLTIIVEGEGGIRQRFSSAPEGVEGAVVRLNLEGNHFQLSGSVKAENNRNGKSKNNCLFEALAEAIPQIRNMTPREFRAEIANCIERDPNIRYHIQQGWHALPLSIGAVGGARKTLISTNILNEQAEKQSPYQHSDRGGWEFCSSKDQDLRKVGPLSNKELHSQRAEAFNQALSKMKQKLSNIGKLRKSVGPENFEATKYDLVLCTREFGEKGVALYPVEIEAAVEVWVRDIGENVKYTLRIDFDNPVIEPGLQGPHGPHIGYDIIPHNKQAPKGVTGHILINQVKNEKLPDRGRSRYSIDDNNIPRIPITRVFFAPNNANTYLERIDANAIFEIEKKVKIKPKFKRETRGRTYPTPDF